MVWLVERVARLTAVNLDVPVQYTLSCKLYIKTCVLKLTYTPFMGLFRHIYK